jgi:hypothetical protein
LIEPRRRGPESSLNVGGIGEIGGRSPFRFFAESRFQEILTGNRSISVL